MHLPAENEVVNGPVSLQLRGHIQNVMVLGQRHSKGFSLHDAVERKLFHFVGGRDSDDVAQLVNNVLHHCSGFGIDNAFSTARQAVNLTLRIATGTNSRNFFNGGHIFSATILEGFPQIVETDQGGAMVSATFVIGGSLQVLEKVGFEDLGAIEVGSNDGK